MMPTITIEHVRSWRRTLWDDDVPSREAWLVACSEHSHLGKDSSGEPWGYDTSGRASGVVSRHCTAYHRGTGYMTVREERAT